MDFIQCTIFLFLHLLIWGCFYWTYAQEARTAYGHPLMVGLTKGQTEDPAVQKLLKDYRTRLKKWFFAFLLLGALLLLPAGVLFLLVWLLLLSAAELMFPSRIAAQARKELLRLKAEQGWKIPARETRKIDLKLDRRKSNRSRIPLYWYLIPTGFYAGIGLYALGSRDTGTAFVLTAALGFLIMAAGIALIRWLPNKTWCADTEVNQKLNGWKKYTASLCWLELSVTDAAVYLALLLYLEQERLLYLFLGLFFLAVCLLCLVLQLKLYQSARRQLLADKEVYAYDEDDYWSFGLWGLRYYNPYDPQVFKENNSGGLNQTVNMAQTSGKWLAAGTVLFVVGIGLFVAWQFAYPAWLDGQGKLADLTVQGEILKAESPLYEAEIPLEEILTAELVQELGEGTRTNGASTGHYGKGKFRYDRYGDVQVYAAWKHPPYLVLATKDGTWIVNDDDPQKTREIYESIGKGKERDSHDSGT